MRNHLVRSLLFCVLASSMHAFAQEARRPPTFHPKQAQPESGPPAITLRATSTIELPVLPFAYFGEPLCDVNGNLFFHRDSGQVGGISVLRISASGDDTTDYHLDAESAQKYVFNSFAVSPSGTVFVIAHGLDGSHVVLDFAADGSVRGTNRLETPRHLEVRNVGVFEDGAVLLSGYYNGRAPDKSVGKNYVAIYEPSGKLRVRLKGFGATDGTKDMTQFREGSVAIGRDGFAYFLFRKEVVVLSSTGEVVRRIKFAAPRDRGLPTRLNISGGLLVVVISRNGFDSDLSREYLILDAATGEHLGRYKAGPEMQNQDVCFNESEGFTFLTTDGSQSMKRITAQTR